MWTFVRRHFLRGYWLFCFAGVAHALPAGFSAWMDAQGPNHQVSLTANIQAATADVGRTSKLYLVVALPDGSMYGLSATGWQALSGGSLPSYSNVTLGLHSIPLVSRAAVQSLGGTVVYIGYGDDVQDMLARQTYARVYTVGGPLAGAAAAGDLLTFSINVQDFSYPELSAAAVTRIVDLHETYKLPVDIYLSDTMLDIYQTSYPALMQRLTSSHYVALNYHIRPPKPYYNGYDWAGLTSLSATEQTAKIKEYESFVTDLATGLSTSRAGGYKQLVTLANARPAITAAFQAEGVLLEPAATAFRELGATWTLAHTGGVLNLGDSGRGLFIRPEHFDLLLFQSPGVAASSLIDAAFQSAHDASGARAPFFVGAKMHDNDFFAQRSAWLTVYIDSSRRPPWNTSSKAPLKSDADQAAQWVLYEGALQYAKNQAQRLGVANAAGIAQLRVTGTPTLHVSGTMHIESAVTNWPNIDALLAFFARATATGKVGAQTSSMKWSIGADINWLEKEPRAGEVIRTLSTLGVEWDIHAHSAADRVRCAERIRALGGAPNGVASGLISTEIDGLRAVQTGTGGERWQAETLWGIVVSDGHTTGADDTAAGVWQPRSTADFKAHDPDANLVAVGNAGRTLAAAESLANSIATGAYIQPVYSATLNVAPKTLKVVGTADGIDQIEAWANRVGALPAVKWSSISGTATAWRAAGALASRVNP
jgi:hypothetical protein